MDRAGDSFQSPDQQRRANAAIVALTPDARIIESIEELDESGGTMNRPGIQRAIELVESGEADGIVVAWLDRWARTLEALELIERWAAEGRYFISAAERFDATTSHGKFALGMMLLVAKLYRDQSTERWDMTLEDAVMRRGIHPAGYGAYGYSMVNRRYVPDDAAPFVLEAFVRRGQQRQTYATIADWLNREAPPNHRLDKATGEPVDRPWTGPAVQRMLARRVYLGEAHYGDYVNPEAHEAIVPEHIWLAAQQPIHGYSKKRQGDAATLQGLVRCAGCRYLMSPGRSGGKRPSRQYRCRKNHVSGTCPAPANVDADRLELYVDEMVVQLLESRAAELSGQPDTDELAEAQRALDEARADVAEMRADTTARKRLGHRWMEFLEPYLAAEEEAERQLSLVASRSHATGVDLTAAAYLALDREQRLAVLPSLIGAVMVRRGSGPRGPYAVPLDQDRVRVLLPEELPDDLPARSQLASGVRSWAWPDREALAG
jgi:DNA invertase Pin-like site-specific DNA recombinase